MKKLIYQQAFNVLMGIFLLGTVANAQNKSSQIEQVKLKVLADKNVAEVQVSEERMTPSFIRLKATVGAYPAVQAGQALNALLHTREGRDLLKENKQITLDETSEVLEFQQYYKGVKVDRATYKAYVNNGTVQFYNGAFYKLPETIGVQPSINEAKALQLAKARIGATKYAEEDFADKMNKATNLNLKNALKADLEDALPKGELVFIKDFTKEHVADVRLAYKFNIYASQPLSRSYVYVDANDGHILLIDPIIKHVEDGPPPPLASVTTPVVTRYAGTRNIYVKQISGNEPNTGQTLQSSHPTNEVYVPGSPTYVLMDDSRGSGIETYDLNGVGGLPISVAPAYTQAKSFTDINNNWTVAEHKRGGANEAENDDIAWDAHWGAEIVYDYWKNKHNRLSYDGKDAKIKSFIHSGAGYDNAFWNGSVMTYGDGSYPAPGGFKPLTSLDVCGHEIGHGVCSNTSDLVYAYESGAMNEALSDIWASCIEYYAIKNVDASLGSLYKPFHIGEQISADPAHPLRRMDSPKAESNPDTYGGQYWTAQPGCSPTLVNDQCGVHNNSGVLNKWFYLITVGSGAGSGPDIAYAGVDDGMADSVAGVHPAYSYSVKGLGFNLSEKVTYLMETMLSSTATYAEARTVSIAAANQLGGGPCSAMVETITNAWYAVGIGAAFVKPCAPTYGFLDGLTSTTTTEAGAAKGCGSYKTVTVPVILPATSTATFTYAGTAANGEDYIASATLSNTTAIARRQFVLVKIFDDAAIEGDETIVINVALTNVGSNPVNTQYTLTVTDDDVVPVISTGTDTLLKESFTRADGFADPAGWMETLEIAETPAGNPTGSGKNQWGIFDNALAITGKDAVTDTRLPNRNYNNLSESRTTVKVPLIDARGLSNIRLKFDYVVQGEVDPAGADPESFPALDYMAVMYSFDGLNYSELTSDGLRQFGSAAVDSGKIDVSLPASFSNKQFYLGFRWNNDANAGGPVSVSVDNLLVTAVGRNIENDVTYGTRQTIGSLNDVYFISDQDQQVVARLKNKSAINLGCAYSYVERTGEASYTVFREAGSKYRVASKVIRIDPASRATVSATVTLFFKESQLAGLEAATGKSRNVFQVFKVDSTSFGYIRKINTTILPATYTAIPGIGGYYTADFTGRAAASYTIGALAPGASAKEPMPIVGKTFSDELKSEVVYPNPTRNNLQYPITSVSDEKLSFEIVTNTGQMVMSQRANVTKGYSNTTLQTSSLATGTYFVYVRNSKGEIVDRQKFVKQ